jgi:hypothetical protein
MRKFCYWLSALIICTRITQARLPDDKEAVSTLIGTWIVPLEQLKPFDEHPDWIKQARYVFRRDGTFALSGLLKGDGHALEIEIEGKWKIEKGVLIQEFTNSNHSALFPLGKQLRDVIVSISQKKFCFREQEEERCLTRQN